MYNYIFVRTDIPVRHQMAQACHAALETGKMFNRGNDIPDSIVVIGVDSQEELEFAFNYIKECGIDCVMFCEPDWDYGNTSFGTEAITGGKRQHLKGYSTWKLKTN